MTASFEQLKSSYPSMVKEDFFRELGGQWPDLVDHPNYQNTCAVRLSVAWKGAGLSIPQRFKEAQDGAGSPLVLKVRMMRDLVVSEYGQPDWGMSKQPGVPINSSDIPRSSGIIAYHANWGHATGHFDLWDKTGFVGSGNFSDIQDGHAIEMWFLS